MLLPEDNTTWFCVCVLSPSVLESICPTWWEFSCSSSFFNPKEKTKIPSFGYLFSLSFTSRVPLSCIFLWLLIKRVTPYSSPYKIYSLSAASTPHIFLFLPSYKEQPSYHFPSSRSITFFFFSILRDSFFTKWRQILWLLHPGQRSRTRCSRRH